MAVVVYRATNLSLLWASTGTTKVLQTSLSLPEKQVTPVDKFERSRARSRVTAYRGYSGYTAQKIAEADRRAILSKVGLDWDEVSKELKTIKQTQQPGCSCIGPCNTELCECFREEIDCEFAQPNTLGCACSKSTCKNPHGGDAPPFWRELTRPIPAPEPRSTPRARAAPKARASRSLSPKRTKTVPT